MQAFFGRLLEAWLKDMFIPGSAATPDNRCMQVIRPITPLGRRRIVIAPDAHPAGRRRPTLREQLRAGLIEAGYAVDEADNGRDAHFLGDTEAVRCRCSTSVCRCSTA
jgi:hypothetical protein